ncbi:unnamed protein product [Rotaria sp. Silwood1]|nr:unnamed protein product [Rotaria sp. Silwood1]
MVLFIISGACATQCLQFIHSFPVIDSIFIFCASPEKYRNLMGNAYPKVLACIDTEQELVRRVRSWIDLKYQTYFYTCNNGDLSKQLSRSTALFLANYVLAKYVEFEIYDESKQDMLQLCREHYSRNQLELNNIKEFELTYTASDAIMWYTRASFVYKMINRALRTFDEIKLRTMAFFIRDLRQQLKNYYQSLQWRNNITVYRGMCISIKDLQRIRDISGNSLLSTNGFFSTSLMRDIALAYANKKYDTMKVTFCRVLFEINIDIVNSPVIFADVSHVSKFPDEKEILFDIGTIFQTKSVHYDDALHLWIIRLTTSTRQAHDSVETLLASTRQGLQKQNNNENFIELIRSLINYDQTEELLNKQDVHGPVVSPFRSKINHVLSRQDDRSRSFFTEYVTSIVKRVVSRIHVDIGKFNFPE